MRTEYNFRRKTAGLLLAVLLFAFVVNPVLAQDDEQWFRKEELVQMLAPIALYPDSLIAQILMAATYPLDVVEAERWLRSNDKLADDDLYDALRDKSWDPSVKSLCNFPDVLFAMSDELDQTRRLGEAFLRQEQEVMDTIQELRWKARDYGTLASTGEQRVIVEREIIRIEPAAPSVVYVPVYDPYYVYGPWWYPAYPPDSWYYPARPYVGRATVVFGPRFFIGAGLLSWVWFDWQVHRIHIDAPVAYRFHRYPVRPTQDRYYWRHDPKHRGNFVPRDRKSPERSPASPQSRPSPERRDEVREKRGEPTRTTVQPSGSSTRDKHGQPPEAERRDHNKTREPEKGPELRQEQQRPQPQPETRSRTNSEGGVAPRPGERSLDVGKDRREPEKSQAEPPRNTVSPASPGVRESVAPTQESERREPKAREPEKSQAEPPRNTVLPASPGVRERVAPTQESERREPKAREPEKSQAEPPRNTVPTARPATRERLVQPPESGKSREPEKAPEARQEPPRSQPQLREGMGSGQRPAERREEGRRPAKEEKKSPEEEAKERGDSPTHR